MSMIAHLIKHIFVVLGANLSGFRNCRKKKKRTVVHILLKTTDICELPLFSAVK